MTHLPGYVVNADTIKGKGVDSIVCMSVNDAFVMGAWGKAQNADEIIMLADGNGELISSPLPSASMMISSAFCALPQAPMTNASLTDMQTMLSTPLPLMVSALTT